jgi:hypothetical protein
MGGCLAYSAEAGNGQEGRIFGRRQRVRGSVYGPAPHRKKNKMKDQLPPPRVKKRRFAKGVSKEFRDAYQASRRAKSN